ncbi:hypothetical protein COTS27_01157 [Spirochaetota bacterium]|nr:hypothetical protein COTS27_01157 [Spirochaetota bacterium]
MSAQHKHTIDPNKQVARHFPSHSSQSSNLKSGSYKAKRDQEINENIARLEKQGVVFHYNRNPSHRRPIDSARSHHLASTPHSSARAKEAIPTRTYLRFSFMLCCLSIIFYYILVYIF